MMSQAQQASSASFQRPDFGKALDRNSSTVLFLKEESRILFRIIYQSADMQFIEKNCLFSSFDVQWNFSSRSWLVQETHEPRRTEIVSCGSAEQGKLENGSWRSSSQDAEAIAFQREGGAHLSDHSELFYSNGMTAVTKPQSSDEASFWSWSTALGLSCPDQNKLPFLKFP